jgi:hypothetical protein
VSAPAQSRLTCPSSRLVADINPCLRVLSSTVHSPCLYSAGQSDIRLWQPAISELGANTLWLPMQRTGTRRRKPTSLYSRTDVDPKQPSALLARATPSQDRNVTIGGPSQLTVTVTYGTAIRGIIILPAIARQMTRSDQACCRQASTSAPSYLYGRFGLGVENDSAASYLGLLMAYTMKERASRLHRNAGFKRTRCGNGQVLCDLGL